MALEQLFDEARRRRGAERRTGAPLDGRRPVPPPSRRPLAAQPPDRMLPYLGLVL